MTDVFIYRQGTAGRITLNRPEALNALIHGMVNTIRRALAEWDDDRTVSLVIIDGAGEKAFCAGGDIVDIYETGRKNLEKIRLFWSDEYQLNATLSAYQKPIVTLLHGVVMVGGVGVGCHASHRIVTESSLIAMLEVTIGFCPDVGGTWLLGKAPGHLGEYLGLTGFRMNAGDAIVAGFADQFVQSTKIHALVHVLAQTGDTAAIENFAESPADSQLIANRETIDAHFAKDSISSIIGGLTGTEFAEKTAASPKAACPSATSAALHAIRAARLDDSMIESLAREYRYSCRALDGDNFFEGIRAAVIDKDRTPKWRPSRIEDVSQHNVREIFSSLGDDEWKWIGKQ